VGPYTAAAVASIGHGVALAAVDVNARRVVARAACGVVDPAAADGAALDAAADRLVDRERPGDWNQAVMDLGREVCRPKPRCDVCPVATWCAWRAAGGSGNGSVTRHRGRAGRAQGRFEGSFRELRGGVIRELRRGPANEARLAGALGRPTGDVRRAVEALTAEGSVERSTAGTVRLAEERRGGSPSAPAPLLDL
jgi:A/G-specific adenine glycosylase